MFGKDIFHLVSAEFILANFVSRYLMIFPVQIFCLLRGG